MTIRRFVATLAAVSLATGIVISGAPFAAPAGAASDPIAGLVAQVSAANIHDTTAAFVAFGPRTVSQDQRFVDESCTLGATVYPVNNYVAAAQFAMSAFTSIGYSPVEEDNGSAGPNVMATKTGTAYPNAYIEFTGHLDSVGSTPGANDDAAGAAAVIELARVLKDYPSRYSMRFVLFANEEAGFTGSVNHVANALGRGESIKADLNMDGIGWPATDGQPTNLVYSNTASDPIAKMFDNVRAAFGISIGYTETFAVGGDSDQRSYWANGIPAITSLGGWYPGATGYHGCGDGITNLNDVNAQRSTQQNLAVGLQLDLDIVPPTLSLSVAPSSIGANGTDTSVATATATDASGHPLTSETIEIASDGDVTVGPVVNNADGTYTATITASHTPGSQTITATDGTVKATATLRQSYACPGTCLTDTTAADFNRGTVGTGAYVASIDDGEVTAAPALGAEFSTDTAGPPAGWAVAAYNGTPAVTVAGGNLLVNAAQVSTGSYAPGQVLEFAATFSSGNPYQAVGFNLPGGYHFAMIGMDSTGAHLSIWTESSVPTFTLPDSLVGHAHVFRIEWTATTETYFVDGVQVHQDTAAIAGPLALNAQDWSNSDGPLEVDWMHLLPYAPSGLFTSRVFDAGQQATWQALTWTADQPPATSVAMSVRAGDTASPDGSWAAWKPTSNGAALGISGRYLQYRATLTTTDPMQAALVRDVSAVYKTTPDTTRPTITARAPAPGSSDVNPSTQVTATFSEPMNPASITASSLALRVRGALSDIAASVTYDPSALTIALTPSSSLKPLQTYDVTLSSSVTDLAGNSLGADSTWSFTTSSVRTVLTDTTVGDFSGGTLGTDTYISQMDNGEVIATPALAQEFGGSAVPVGWNVAAYNGTPSTSVSGGLLNADAAQIRTSTAFPAGTYLEFSAKFLSGNPYQAVGFFRVDAFQFALFAMNDTGTTLQTNTNNTSLFNLPTTLLGGFHRYGILWTPTTETFFVDGNQVHQDSIAIAGLMNIDAQDYGPPNGSFLQVDWQHVSPYAATGTFTSRVFDGGGAAVWQTLAWTADEPTATSVSMRVRAGDLPSPEGTWTAWMPASNGGALGLAGRYLQYQATLVTGDPLQSAVLRDVTATASMLLPPTAADDTYGTDAGAPLVVPAPGVLSNDSNPAPGALTAELVSGPSNGALTLESDGSFAYTPSAGYSGADEFRYNARNSAGPSNTATVTITITKVSQAQSIDFPAIADQTFGDPDFAPGATATSGLPVSYRAAGSCSVTSEGLIHITGAGACTVTASQAGNATYEPATDVSRSFTIGKAPLQMSAKAASMAYGGPVPSFSATVVGLVGTDTFGGLGGSCGAVVAGKAVSSSTPAGTYAAAIACSLTTSSNYDVASSPATLTVTRVPLTITADNQTVAFSSRLPALGASITGFVNGEGASSLGGTLICLTTARINAAEQVLSSAGSYTVSCSGLVSTNYAISYVGGKLTVVPEDNAAQLAAVSNNLPSKGSQFDQARKRIADALTPSLWDQTTGALSRLNGAGFFDKAQQAEIQLAAVKGSALDVAAAQTARNQIWNIANDLASDAIALANGGPSGANQDLNSAVNLWSKGNEKAFDYLKSAWKKAVAIL